jgi:RHS repeat-associated protein
MRVIQERDGSNNPQVVYTRGPDLSGTLEGAGGIGGLLARSDQYSSGNPTRNNYYHADGNGNITYLVDSSQGLAARYRYDPFGNTIASGGTLEAANVYRFSSKECHTNSAMYYYLYRFYVPNLQRWLNRDPVGEAWGLDLYQFVSNDPLSELDHFGLRATPAPAAPNIDTCNPQQRQDIQTAMPQACNRVRKSCSDPNCMGPMADAAQGCKKKPKVECAKPGDKLCNGQHCGYQDGNTIVLCPNEAFPANGQNCQGIGGPMTLDCILVHELQHVGANGKNQDDANKAQQCVGCPYGKPHTK